MISFNKDQIYIVTGASSGIGEDTAILLNELGATVVGMGRNEERLQAMRSKCRFPENMHLEVKDLAEDIEGLPQYVKELKNKYGKFSGLAYCAGYAIMKSLAMTTYEDLFDIFQTNFFAPAMFLKGFCDRRNNIGKGGSVVIVSSIAPHVACRGQLAYAASKAALTTASRIIAREVVQSGLRVNVLSPADIKTPMTMAPEIYDLLRQKKELSYPFGFGKPRDVANLIAFMLSNCSKWLTAQDYIMDCGALK